MIVRNSCFNFVSRSVCVRILHERHKPHAVLQTDPAVFAWRSFVGGGFVSVNPKVLPQHPETDPPAVDYNTSTTSRLGAERTPVLSKPESRKCTRINLYMIQLLVDTRALIGRLSLFSLSGGRKARVIFVGPSDDKYNVPRSTPPGCMMSTHD